MVVQYLRFAGNALQGDLGNSYFYSKPTLEVIDPDAMVTKLETGGNSKEMR